MAVSSIHNGWRWDRANSRLDVYYRGTRVGHFNASLFLVAVGDIRATLGNIRLGAVETFATTEPTQWIVFKSGTQPAGAITTSGGLGANDTTVQKIIAAGTINNVET